MADGTEFQYSTALTEKSDLACCWPIFNITLTASCWPIHHFSRFIYFFLDFLKLFFVMSLDVYELFLFYICTNVSPKMILKSKLKQMFLTWMQFSLDRCECFLCCTVCQWLTRTFSSYGPDSYGADLYSGHSQTAPRPWLHCEDSKPT